MERSDGRFLLIDLFVAADTKFETKWKAALCKIISFLKHI